MAANQSAFRSRLNTGATSARIAADRTSFQGRLNPRVAGNLTGNGSAFSRRVPDGTPVTDNGNVINPTAASTANNRNWAGNRNRSRNGNWSGNNGNWSGKDCGYKHHPRRHHHHHHFVFGGGFYPYSWYYPYDYGYYEPVVYADAGIYDDGSLVAEVQSRFASAGYYYGSIDGVMGPATRRAIRAYQRARGLPVDGLISEPLVATMGLR